jgi:hypothetical protein
MIGWLKQKYHRLWKDNYQNQKLDQLHQSLQQREPIILVHQLGRAGSMSMVNTLRAMNTGMDVYHTHWLNADSLARRTRQFANASESDIPYNVRVSLAITRDLTKEEIAGYPWRIVSIIREPVGRNISAFFLSLHRFVESPLAEYKSGRLSNQMLLDKFLRDFPHQEPLVWFDREVRDVFGLDAYVTPFSWEQGYCMLTHDPLKMLIVRVEDLNRAYQDMLEAMFAVRPEVLVNTHISSEDEDYADIYKKFLAEVSLPKDYLDSMYQSQYARHFYSPGEIDGYYKKWMKRAD